MQILQWGVAPQDPCSGAYQRSLRLQPEAGFAGCPNSIFAPVAACSCLSVTVRGAKEVLTQLRITKYTVLKAQVGRVGTLAHRHIPLH